MANNSTICKQWAHLPYGQSLFEKRLRFDINKFHDFLTLFMRNHELLFKEDDEGACTKEEGKKQRQIFAKIS